MGPSLVHFFGHCVVTAGFFFLAVLWDVRHRWAWLTTILFFIAPSAVAFIWGPYRLYWLYGLTFFLCLAGAKLASSFYDFLKTQEVLVRYLFLAGVAVLCGGVLSMTFFDIRLRHDALTFWKQQIQKHPSADVMMNLADAYTDVKNLAQAKEFYLKAAAQDPHSARAYEGLAFLAKLSGQWQEAAENYQQLLALQPQSQEVHLELGQAYRALGKTKEAVKTYGALLKLYPDNERVYVKVIEAYGQAIAYNPHEILYQEKREEVLADLEQLSKRKKYTAVDYFNLAFLYEQVGGYEEAIRFYKKSLELKPTYEKALYNLANRYQEMGDLKTALVLYGRLVHFHPRFALGYLNMGVVYNSLGDVDQARRLYQKTMAIDPSNAGAYFNLGYLSEAQGELKEALNYYEKAVDNDPQLAEGYYNMGNVYAALGQNAEAIASYLKTVSINKNHQNAFVNLSILSFKSRDFAGAIRYLEEARLLGYNPPAEYLRSLAPYRKK
ncbi:MAG: tetratricopeptide repeat protein [Candidatus Omnitrophica bacterium]|nr:tetratricopeptide repeat protein [Candidatus Omnitrophota bacterium]